MSEQHPVVDRYLQKLEQHLDSLPADDRREVLKDIRSHLAEATAAGTSLDAALEKLGPADELARAYAVEALINPRGEKPGGSRLGRFLKVAGLVVVGSIPTLIIVVTLGAVGLAFSASGLAVLTVGIVASVAELPYWIRLDVPPILAILAGPVMTAFGILALIGLGLYVRFAAYAVRAVLPK